MQISNLDLLQALKKKIQNERELTLEILNLLKEVEMRKLHLDLGYSSLHAFCVEELKYSDGAAQRRIQSMRLLNEVPQAKIAIMDGKLNLTTVSLVQNFLVSQKKEEKHYSKIQKSELLKSMEGKSKKETERELFKLSPEFIPKEKERALTEDKTEIKFVADSALLKKLQDLKSLMSHKNPQFSYAELIEELADMALKKLEKKTGCNSTPPAEQKGTENLKIHTGKSHSRYIPLPLRRLVWQRDQGQCEYVSPLNNKKCASRFQLQIDHIHPFSQGGLSLHPENLRLLCSQHNRRRITEKTD